MEHLNIMHTETGVNLHFSLECIDIKIVEIDCEFTPIFR